ncbi:MAG: MogA/MoaB family molybdenum cofactor biosynthesis protein [candidate division KSB1 bacterium]
MSAPPFRIALITLSDRVSAGERSDEGGKVLSESLSALPHTIIAQLVLPDEAQQLLAQLINLADHERADLILTTGGTGLSRRDITPEATLAVIERRVPGMEEAIRAYGLTKTRYAMLSRAVVGVRGQTLIINLPGNPQGVRESLEVVLPVLPHALKLLRDERIADQEHRFV